MCGLVFESFPSPRYKETDFVAIEQKKQQKMHRDRLKIRFQLGFLPCRIAMLANFSFDESNVIYFLSPFSKTNHQLPLIRTWFDFFTVQQSKLIPARERDGLDLPENERLEQPGSGSGAHHVYKEIENQSRTWFPQNSAATFNRKEKMWIKSEEEKVHSARLKNRFQFLPCGIPVLAKISIDQFFTIQ